MKQRNSKPLRDPMTQPMKKVTVTILGESYNLMSDDPEHTVHEAARLVDQSFRDMQERARGAGAAVSEHHIAVLTALRIALAGNTHKHEFSQRAHHLVSLIEKNVAL